MGMMDKVKGMFGKHQDKGTEGVDKAARAADEKTGGKRRGQTDTGADKTKDAIDRLNEDKGDPGRAGS